MTELSGSLCERKYAFIGCGNMATAIIAGLVRSGVPGDQIIASNPSQPKLDYVAANYGVKTTMDNQAAAAFAEIVILAVKPQKLPDVCSSLASVDFSNKLIISVAAGFQSAEIAIGLGQNPTIIRAMPNTPALIGLGATGLYASADASTQQRQIAESIFNATGTSVWVERESQINVVTAIAGSSPAYFFMMMQAMIEQAVASGMEPDAAATLVTQAASGAAQLAQQVPEKSLDTLRREVTSPGGTTAAAISSFKSDHFEATVKKAVRAAIRRGIELGNPTSD